MNLQEWKQEYKGIRHKLFSCDKDAQKVIQLCKSLAGLAKFVEKSDMDRERERDSILRQISGMRSENAAFSQSLKSFDKTPVYLQRIQLMSESLEGKMSQFKEQQMYIFDNIAAEEDALESDLQLFNERLPYYENARFSHPQQQQQQQQQPDKKGGFFQIYEDSADEQDEDDEDNNYYETNPHKQSNKPIKRNHAFDKENKQGYANEEEELGDIDSQLEQFKMRIDALDKKILANGGKNQGWQNQDQQDFLKIRVRHKNQITKQAFLNDCLSVLGMFEEEEIREHIDRFSKYLAFEEEKKVLLSAYKDLKESRKQVQVSHLRKEEAQSQVKKSVLEADQKQQAALRQKQKDEIRQWKMKKQAQQEVKEDQNKHFEDEENREKERLRRIQLEEQRKYVEEYKQLKEYEKNRVKEREEYEKQMNKKLVTASDLERIRTKEEEMLRKRTEVLAKKAIKKESTEVAKQKHEELKTAKYAYVQSKLTDQTTAAKMKQGEKVETGKIDRFGSTASSFGGNPVRFTGRAVPSWRNGI